MHKALWIEPDYFCFLSISVFSAGTTYKYDTWDWIVAYECGAIQNINVEYVFLSQINTEGNHDLLSKVGEKP